MLICLRCIYQGAQKASLMPCAALALKCYLDTHATCVDRLAMSLFPGGEVFKPESLLKGQLGSLFAVCTAPAFRFAGCTSPTAQCPHTCSHQSLQCGDEMLCFQKAPQGHRHSVYMNR